MKFEFPPPGVGGGQGAGVGARSEREKKNRSAPNGGGESAGTPFGGQGGKALPPSGGNAQERRGQSPRHLGDSLPERPKGAHTPTYGHQTDEVRTQGDVTLSEGGGLPPTGDESQA